MSYDYMDTMKEDIKEYIDDNVNLKDYSSREKLEEKLYEDLWISDSVTGNASGSYTCDVYEAEENVAHNWDLLAEAIHEFGQEEINVIEKGAEWADVTIRCYLLSQALNEVLDDMEDELDEVFSYDDEENDDYED